MSRLAVVAGVAAFAACVTAAPVRLPEGPIVDLTTAVPRGVTPPVLAEGANPWAMEQAYPMLARQESREGVVVAHLTLDAAGAVAKVDVVEDPGFDFADAATALLLQFRFTPAERDGAPIASKIVWRLRFGLAP